MYWITVVRGFPRRRRRTEDGQIVNLFVPNAHDVIAHFPANRGWRCAPFSQTSLWNWNRINDFQTFCEKFRSWSNLRQKITTATKCSPMWSLVQPDWIYWDMPQRAAHCIFHQEINMSSNLLDATSKLYWVEFLERKHVAKACAPRNRARWCQISIYMELSAGRHHQSMQGGCNVFNFQRYLSECSDFSSWWLVYV